jgi:hypothetical protein
VFGYASNDGRYIYLCPHCDKPTYFAGNIVMPGVPFGSPVAHLPDDIEAVYSEARRCASASAYTAAVLLSRKLLMNIAVSLGAKTGDTFMAYIEYLSAAGYVPPNGKAWVDHIRKKGNEATHEISVMKPSDAEDLLLFSEMLLKFIYEFPKKVPSQAPAS